MSLRDAIREMVRYREIVGLPANIERDPSSRRNVFRREIVTTARLAIEWSIEGTLAETRTIEAAQIVWQAYADAHLVMHEEQPSRMSRWRSATRAVWASL